MGLFENVFKKEEPKQEAEQEEKKLELTAELKDLIAADKWEEIFKHKIYDSGYDTWDIDTIKTMLYEAFAAKYPNIKQDENTIRIFGKICDSIEGWYEVPVKSYLDSNGNFDSERYENTCDLHCYNPMLNLIASAKDIIFNAECFICLNNMWADGEIDAQDFFVEINNWLADPALFAEGKWADDMRKTILLKKYEGGKENA